MTTTIVIIVIVAILAIWLVSIYNRLVKLRNNRENAFANIDVQLKQRCDLIPQLVATVKGYATHEKETLQRVTDARAASMGAQTINDKVKADNMMTSALAGLKVSLEAYPDLKANQNFIQLQEEIADIENKLASSTLPHVSSTMPWRLSQATSSPRCSDSPASLCSRFRRRAAPQWRRLRKSNSKPRPAYQFG